MCSEHLPSKCKALSSNPRLTTKQCKNAQRRNNPINKRTKELDSSQNKKKMAINT
jgi:hypothetical protein